jgi:hypothetical protein
MGRLSMCDSLDESRFTLIPSVRDTCPCGLVQLPGKTQYSMVFYFACMLDDIEPGSVLDEFIKGSDAHRNKRFKFTPRIAEVREESNCPRHLTYFTFINTASIHLVDDRSSSLCSSTSDTF